MDSLSKHQGGRSKEYIREFLALHFFYIVFIQDYDECSELLSGQGVALCFMYVLCVVHVCVKCMCVGTSIRRL